VAGAIEIVAGVLVAIGLFTRAAAFVASGEMAAGYFMAHFPKSFFPLVNGGDAAVLYCFIFLFLALEGGGPWSIDAARSRT
jgi:putative oxidoreductase